ncbi:hypothetical protein Ga0080574_TMP5017 (plasmid) [Salipiger abyssi]|uniref:Uncharacterized protein n=1 Tax=Salipiger abyssi TaxID=1250539 RepID=A0A1P8V0Y8_9RHOB|nr:hypothetical protein Ga0080574_TMP5017 [Salipiger abyssi]
MVSGRAGGARHLVLPAVAANASRTGLARWRQFACGFFALDGAAAQRRALKADTQ